MSAVDFIVEMKDKFLFIEVKDLEHPLALKYRKAEELEKFIEDLKKPVKIARKFKDSLLKELAKGTGLQKEVLCILILEYNKFDAAQRRKIYEDLRNVIPRFNEDYFPAIKKVDLAPLYNTIDFQDAFPMFKVTAIASPKNE